MISWLLNTIALLFAVWLVPGLHLGGFWDAVLAVVVIGLINLFVGWLLVLVTLPFTVITLGFFLFVVNALLFWMAGGVFDGFRVDGFWPALWGSLTYSVTAGVLKALVGIK